MCLGCYATEGFLNPVKSKEAKNCQFIEITDNATVRMKRSKVLNSVLDAMVPHPLRFKQVWHMARGSKSLYAWKAVPKEGFVAMGMICTSTGL